MTIMTEITREIADLVRGNQLYQDYQARWKFMLESYLGGEEYRQGNHLTRYQLETDSEYIARLKATPLENHCKSVVSVYNSFLFREEPDREYGSITNAPELEDFLKDADLEGRSLDAFMKDVATWSAVFGHAWIIMAKGDIGATSRADELAQGVRPYVNLLTPLTVLDWSWQRDATGRYELDYLRYVEEVNGDVRTLKEWTKDSIRTFTVDMKETKYISDETVVNGLGMIPAVICYNARSTVRGIGVSAISDIADAQKYIYNATSEIFQSIQLDTHPSLVVTPDAQIGTGSGAVIKVDPSQDPGLKPYVLDFGGSDINNILAAIKHTIESVDKMANTGAVRATESRTMSGVAMETEFALLNARLSEMADNLELAEEQMWRLFCWYQGYSYDMEIEYPGSFNIRDNSMEIQQLQTAKSAATDARVIAAIDAKILDWLDLDEDELVAVRDPAILNLDTIQEGEDYQEFTPHEMTDPVTGETLLTTSREQHIRLANLGWIHKGDE